ncbi:MAG: carboxylating nicotinate-nucleotide diphosphorylase [Myxococcales bacterium]|jgi:nicotinate-nucleotide pyrophosphorylase (carboxylating)|nr:carboxylating nicotinate-nucleotide diphosphorylase [Myxococcales bacterium]
MDSIDRLIELALDEDLGSAGDITTNATIGAQARGRACFLAKAPLVVAGLDIAKRVFDRLDARCLLTCHVKEGDAVAAGQRFATIEGPYRALLTGERTALNFLQRLSGIATATRRAVEALDGTGCQLLDTRKTTPGWRALEKAAVRTGGGHNHRFGLFDGVLIKDNHIEAVGSIAETIRRTRAATHHLLRIEVEVESMAQVEEALAAGADVLMLDNMDLDAMCAAVRHIDGRALTEASGGIRTDRLRAVAETGVTVISMGAITHSAGSVDISLDVQASD